MIYDNLSVDWSLTNGICLVEGTVCYCPPEEPTWAPLATPDGGEVQVRWRTLCITSEHGTTRLRIPVLADRLCLGLDGHWVYSLTRTDTGELGVVATRDRESRLVSPLLVCPADSQILWDVSLFAWILWEDDYLTPNARFSYRSPTQYDWGPPDAAFSRPPGDALAVQMWDSGATWLTLDGTGALCAQWRIDGPVDPDPQLTSAELDGAILLDRRTILVPTASGTRVYFSYFTRAGTSGSWARWIIPD